MPSKHTLPHNYRRITSLVNTSYPHPKITLSPPYTQALEHTHYKPLATTQHLSEKPNTT